MKYFNKILSFQKLLKDYNKIYRDLSSIHLPKEADNDIEHSFRVAMLCWMIIDEYKLKLDLNKVIKYSLIHDIVEVYAGDTSIYSNKKPEDKIKLVVLLSEEDHWIKRKISFNEFSDRKQRKIKYIDNFAQNFNKEIMKYLNKNKKKLFSSN